MKRVVIESPYRGDNYKDTERNKIYLKACINDCLKRGESPYASHGFFTQAGILDDRIPEERKLGIDAGLEWGKAAEITVVYTDFGISEGMWHGIEKAIELGRELKIRPLPNLEASMERVKKLERIAADF